MQQNPQDQLHDLILHAITHKDLDKGDKGESCEVQRVIATKINEDPLSQTEFRIVYNNLKQIGITWTQPKPWKSKCTDSEQQN